MASAGRNVTSRQVVFVVKGLALKGHVFSTNDTAERLAEVFREQARYLIGGSGITLDADRETLLAAWIAAPAAPAAKPARPAEPAPKSKPARAAEPAADSKPARKPAQERRPERPAAAKPATPPRVPERPRSAALPSRAAPPPPDTQKPAKPSPDFRAAIAARIAASAKLKPSARPPQGTDDPAPPPPEPAAAPEKAADTLESSILAAIAEAVDVLVEDGGSDTAEPRSAPSERGARQPAARRAAANRPPPPEPPPPAEEPEEGSGDIGDEIQRIVASYNRNRDDERRG